MSSLRAAHSFVISKRELQSCVKHSVLSTCVSENLLYEAFCNSLGTHHKVLAHVGFTSKGREIRKTCKVLMAVEIEHLRKNLQRVRSVSRGSEEADLRNTGLRHVVLEKNESVCKAKGRGNTEGLSVCQILDGHM